MLNMVGACLLCVNFVVMVAKIGYVLGFENIIQKLCFLHLATTRTHGLPHIAANSA